MSGIKEIVILAIFVIFVLPGLIGILWSLHKTTHDPSPENLQEGTEKIVESSLPWWLGILEWLAGLPGIIGAGLIIGFVLFLKWIGEIG